MTRPTTTRLAAPPEILDDDDPLLTSVMSRDVVAIAAEARLRGQAPRMRVIRECHGRLNDSAVPTGLSIRTFRASKSANTSRVWPGS